MNKNKPLLFYKIYGSGTPLVILHGFLGSSDNWLTLTKEWAEKFQIILVDQRNHGRSFHSRNWGYKEMAEDLKNLLDELEIDKVNLLGHSMGGKTVQFFAHLYPQYCEKIIVVDIGIKKRPPDHDSILSPMVDLPLDKITTRKDAEERLSSQITNRAVMAFVLKNLARADNGFIWKANIKLFLEKKEAIGEAVPKMVYPNDILFILGEKSDYVPKHDYSSIFEQYPNAKIEVIENAGHWVHAEKPILLTQFVHNFLLND